MLLVSATAALAGCGGAVGGSAPLAHGHSDVDSNGGPIVWTAVSAATVFATLWSLLRTTRIVLGPRLAARATSASIVLFAAFWALSVTWWQLRAPPEARLTRLHAPSAPRRLRVGAHASVRTATTLAELLMRSTVGGTAESLAVCACVGVWLGLQPTNHLSLRLKLLVAALLLEPLRLWGKLAASPLAAVPGFAPGTSAYASTLTALPLQLPLPLPLPLPLLLAFLAPFLTALVSERLSFQTALLRRLVHHLGVLDDAHRALVASVAGGKGAKGSL